MLLFDQNISFRILKKLPKVFRNSVHINSISLQQKTDKNIWQYAKSNNFSVVTFDADFFDLSSVYGHPPKIIWLRTGNTTTNAIAELLDKNSELISLFINDEDYKEQACLEIS